MSHLLQSLANKESPFPRVIQVMGAIIKPATRIRDLYELYKLMVTDFLPLDDKIKLVDTFPPVIGQIDVFHVNRDTPGGVDGQVQLFNKLYNVKRIELSFPSPFLNSSELVPDPGVNLFL